MSDIVTPWGPIGYITYKRTYSRRLEESNPNSSTEEFNQTVDRVIKACKTQLNVGFTEVEEKRLEEIFLSLKGSVAGRFWWQLGTKTVDKLGLLSLQNCAGTVVDSIRAFTWTMDALMLGSGVGYNIQREYVYQLPKVKKVKIVRQDTNDADLIVPDSREGWVQLLDKVLRSHFKTGKGFTYSTICIRGKGAPIKSFGGLAAGPEELCWGMEQISNVLNARAGKKIRPIDALDIMNIIGFIVVAGNVRRSAQLAVGDMDDLQFLNAKNWSEGSIPNWRAMSNNSVACNDIKLLPEQFWNGYNGTGEAYGLINIKLSQDIGRLGETKYSDKNVIIYNPCQPGFANIYTKKGIKNFSELEIGDEVEVGNNSQFTKVINKWSTGVKDVYCYTTNFGNIFIGTNNHKLVTENGEKLEVEKCYIECFPVRSIFRKNEIIESKHYLGKHEVFDITVEHSNHTYVTGGLVVSNCGEQSLAAYETCCLAEIFLPNISSKEELFEVQRYLYRINKHSLALPCHAEETEEVVHEHMRMGIGVTGYLQATEEQRSWLSDAYRELRKFDKEYSKEHGWPESIKLTTCKPSGCSTGDSLIVTNNGIYRLDELVNKNGAEWQDIKGLKTCDNKNITKGFINGFVPTKKIVTEDGFEYESSLNHKYWVNNKEWKTVEELDINDFFTAKLGGYEKKEEPSFLNIEESHVTSTIQIKQPHKMNPDLAFMFGLVMADGSTHKKGLRISFNRRDNDLVVLLKEIFMREFEITATMDDDHGLYMSSIQLLRWLEVNGLSKDYCDNLSIPRVIRESSKESIVAFINGFWRGDGGQHNINNWSMCSVTKKFAQELAVLCRSVGLNVAIKNAGPGGYGKLDRWILLSRSCFPSRYQGKEFKRKYLGDGLWMDPIYSIQDSVNHTYDISVEETHKYTLNGAVSHNTLSLLPNVTPGVHPAYSKCYLRRIRIASNNPLVETCRQNGYDIEYQKNFDGTDDKNTVIVSFPISVPDGTVVAKDLTAIQQMEYVKRLQTEWSDNAVSCTVYYRPEELPEIKKWLNKNYNKGVKTMSFLLHSDHGFAQAPYEEITQEQFEAYSAKVKPITSGAVNDDQLESMECASGVCPIK